MQDRPLLVFLGMFVAVYAIRLAMMNDMRRWPAEQKARLIDAFYRQNKITSMILLGAMVLMVVPYAVGARSMVFALGMSMTAVAVALAGGIVGNLKLRRLGFPARYVKYHLTLVVLMSTGMLVFTLLLF
jgi:hypothetical protein